MAFLSRLLATDQRTSGAPPSSSSDSSKPKPATAGFRATCRFAKAAPKPGRLVIGFGFAPNAKPPVGLRPPPDPTPLSCPRLVFADPGTAGVCRPAGCCSGGSATAEAVCQLCGCCCCCCHPDCGGVRGGDAAAGAACLPAGCCCQLESGPGGCAAVVAVCQLPGCWESCQVPAPAGGGSGNGGSPLSGGGGGGIGGAAAWVLLAPPCTCCARDALPTKADCLIRLTQGRSA